MWSSPSSSSWPCLLCQPASWCSSWRRSRPRRSTCSLSAAVTPSSTGWPTTSGTWWEEADGVHGMKSDPWLQWTVFCLNTFLPFVSFPSSTTWCRPHVVSSFCLCSTCQPTPPQPTSQQSCLYSFSMGETLFFTFHVCFFKVFLFFLSVKDPVREIFKEALCLRKPA